MQSVAAAMTLDVIPADIRDSEKIDRAVASFAEQPNGGLIVTVDANADGHRKLIFQLAERYRLPAVYPLTFFALDGGLISYAPDQIHQYRQAAGPSGGLPRVTNSVAIGGTADMPRTRRARRSDGF